MVWWCLVALLAADANAMATVNEAGGGGYVISHIPDEAAEATEASEVFLDLQGLKGLVQEAKERPVVISVMKNDENGGEFRMRLGEVTGAVATAQFTDNTLVDG